jgi:hypothetical protein
LWQSRRRFSIFLRIQVPFFPDIVEGAFDVQRDWSKTVEYRDRDYSVNRSSQYRVRMSIACALLAKTDVCRYENSNILQDPNGLA